MTVPRTPDEAVALFASIDADWLTSLQAGLAAVAAFAVVGALLCAAVLLVRGR